MIASWYFIWGWISIRLAEYTGAMTSWPVFHSLLTSDPDINVKVFVQVLWMVASWYLSRVKRICVFKHSVMTNFNCACPAIQRGQGYGFLSESSSWHTACMSEQRRFWRDCADAQAHLNVCCSHRRWVPNSLDVVHFIWGFISMRPAGIYKRHDHMTYMSRSADFSNFLCLRFCHR